MHPPHAYPARAEEGRVSWIPGVDVPARGRPEECLARELAIARRTQAVEAAELRAVSGAARRPRPSFNPLRRLLATLGRAARAAGGRAERARG